MFQPLANGDPVLLANRVGCSQRDVRGNDATNARTAAAWVAVLELA